ncbi:MAG: patatin-like phospholipase family protein, partial [Candidatus Krumholzibacteriia bacterium]
RSFRRKQDDRSDLLDFEFGIRNGKLAFPRSLVAGQKLAFAFDVPALHTAGAGGFDALPIPFRAVATDIRTGEMVVLSSGSLQRALRASMSVPGMFPPVEVDGRLLLDGGMVRNVPVDVVQAMGADVAIAVDVGESLADRSPQELGTLLGLSFQLTTLLVHSNVQEQLLLADAVVSPELGELSMIDFDRAAEAIRIGERAARNASPHLVRFAVPEEQYREFMERHRHVPDAKARIDSLEIVNRTRMNPRLIEAQLAARPGTQLDLDRLRRDLSALYDLGVFESVDFEIVGGNDATVLRVLLNEKNYAPNLIHIGVDFAGELEEKAEFDVVVRLTRVAMNRLGAEWRNDLRAGGTLDAASEWYQPLELSRRLFVAAALSYRSDLRDVFAAGERIAEYRIRRARLRLDAGVQVAKLGELRVGLTTGYVRSRVETGSADLLEFDTREGGWRARFEADWIDDPDFPTRGGAGDVEIFQSRRSLGAGESYDKLSAGWTQFLSWGRNTAFIALEAGSNLGRQIPAYDEFLLGGPTSVAGLPAEGLRGQVFSVARLGGYRPVLSGFDPVGTRLYLAAWLEAGNMWRSVDEARLEDLVGTWTVAVGASTLLGPVYLGYGCNEDGDDTVFFTVGRQFGARR